MVRTKHKHTKKPKEKVFESRKFEMPETKDMRITKVEPVESADEPEAEDVPESEADAMIERAAKRKEVEKQKVEAEVDNQEWTASDPLIPEDLKGRVWIAVYKCPLGHKTKATNRQAKSGIFCGACRISGNGTKAEIMPQFLEKPIPPDDDNEKRKAAARGKA